MKSQTKYVMQSETPSEILWKTCISLVWKFRNSNHRFLQGGKENGKTHQA